MCFMLDKIVVKTWMWNAGVTHNFDECVCIEKGTVNRHTLKMSNLQKAGVCICVFICIYELRTWI
jgi:hypothetical protein